MKKVLCLGLSPVLQRTLRFDRLTPDEVNRARQVMESAAGKALNTARALVTLGTPAITAGFNGGASGARVTAMLKQCGVGDAMTTMPSPTRLCTTLLDDHAGTVTELVEEAPAPGRTALRRFIADNLSRIPGAALLAISGTLPPFAKDDFYVAFVRAARAAGVPVVIDSHRTALIQVLFEQPLLAKLNVAELEATLGEKLNTEARILRGMRDLLNLGAANVFVTQGSRAAYLLTPRAAWRFTPPAIRERVNPIGSGDCTTAGIVHALLRDKRLPDAVRLGLACGSANAETLTPGTFDARRARALCRTVTCEPRMVRETVPQKN